MSGCYLFTPAPLATPSALNLYIFHFLTYSLPKVFNVYLRRLYQLHAVQLHAAFLNMRFQFVPYPHCKILRAGKLPFHKWHVQVQVAVVHFFYYHVFYQVSQQLSIIDKSCLSIRHTLYGHMEFIVMPMPVFVGAFTKHLFILLLAPGFIFQFMGSIKMLYTRQIYHFSYLPAKLALLYGFDKKVLICGMKMLIVAATEAEVAPFTAYLRNSGRSGTVILISGVGMTATAYALTKHLASNKYDFVLQVGVAGSYDHTLALGAIVFVTSDQYGDLGAEDHDDYLDIFEMGLVEKNGTPHTDGRLLTPVMPLHEKISLPRVSGLTVNTVSGNEQTISKRHKKFGSQIESMEGAAFHFVCLQEGIAFAQVRAISNYITPRNKSQWKMKEAIINLNKWLINFVKNL